MAHTRKRMLRPLMALAMVLGLSACASMDTTSRDAPMNAPLTATTDGPPSAPGVLSDFRVVEVLVSVPESLKVSEANRYYPSGDIVWREDPIGNRHAQVRAIVEAGLTRGVQRMNDEGISGGRPVIVRVMVTRFHALSEKARYTIGGVHAIQFYLTVIDAQTGATLVPSKLVKADFDALGGAAAIASEARGVTQKVRITDHLAMVIQQELSHPDGHVTQASGLMEAINQI